jgi:hypothetical protein
MKRAGLLALAAATVAIGIGGSTAQAVPGGSALKATIDAQAPADELVTQARWYRGRHCHRHWRYGRWHRWCHYRRHWYR